MAFLRVSPHSRFIPSAAYALALTLAFIPHVLMAQTGPAPSGEGALAQFDARLAKAFETAERAAKVAGNAVKAAHGVYIDTEEEKEAGKKAEERMQRVSDNASRVDEYMDLRARQDAFERGDPGAGKLRFAEKTRLNLLEKRVVGEWRESQVAMWEAQTGRTWEGGKWPGDFGRTYRIAEAISPSNPGKVLAIGAGLQEYFTQILTAPRP